MTVTAPASTQPTPEASLAAPPATRAPAVPAAPSVDFQINGWRYRFAWDATSKADLGSVDVAPGSRRVIVAVVVQNVTRHAEPTIDPTIGDLDPFMWVPALYDRDCSRGNAPEGDCQITRFCSTSTNDTNSAGVLPAGGHVEDDCNLLDELTRAGIAHLVVGYTSQDSQSPVHPPKATAPPLIPLR